MNSEYMPWLTDPRWPRDLVDLVLQQLGWSDLFKVRLVNKPTKALVQSLRPFRHRNVPIIEKVAGKSKVAEWVYCFKLLYSLGLPPHMFIAAIPVARLGDTLPHFSNLPANIKIIGAIDEAQDLEELTVANIDEMIGGLGPLFRLAFMGVHMSAVDKEGVPQLDRILRALQPPQLTNIKHLGLFQCGMYDLPSALTSLVKLESLDLRRNAFEHLPDVIGRLTNLTTLELGENQLLTALPESIGSLSRLDELHLDDCVSLASLPNSLSALVSVTSFRLCHNTALKSLPASIGGMTRLRRFKMKANVSQVPDSMARLTNLQYLYIGAPVAALPPDIGNLAGLTSLDLANIEAAALPSSLSKLQALTRVSLRGNGTTIDISPLLHITALLKLRIACATDAVPGELSRLTNLRELHLEGQAITQLPDSIGRLQELTKLQVVDTRVTTLPESTSQLQRLVSLTLKDCGHEDITLFPDAILGLTNLQTLRLSQCRLLSIPEAISRLVQLTALDLRLNELEQLPRSLFFMEKLSILDLTQNHHFVDTDPTNWCWYSLVEICAKRGLQILFDANGFFAAEFTYEDLIDPSDDEGQSDNE